MSLLEESYSVSRSITKERAKNFYYGIQLLPKQRRDSLCAAYAFFRISDDLSDDDSIQNKQERLDRWTELVIPNEEYQHEHPILPAFYDTIQRYQIPQEYFRELLVGTTSDLSVSRYETFDELYLYCYRVASTVGLVCLHVFGFDGSQKALEQAEAQGIAFQLTNILRDVAEDGERGRIYLPLEDLRRFDISEQDFLAGAPGPNIENFLSFQIERAKAYYQRSESLPEHVEAESRASLRAMSGIYGSLLGKIESMGDQVFKERAKLSKLEKLALAGKTAIGHYTS